MQIKKSSWCLLALVLVASTVAAQANVAELPSNDPVLPPATSDPTKQTSAQPTSAQTSQPPTTTHDKPTTTDPPSTTPPSTAPPSTAPPATTSAPPSTSAVPSTNEPTRPRPTGNPGGNNPGRGTTSTAPTSSALPPSPTPSSNKEDNSSSSTGKLATAGIAVGSIVVVAAIGIWVFRKWKLSPSDDFQTKIRGDDYQDYPRSYESDTVFLRNLGDQPAEPAAAAKASPYNAHAQATTVNMDEPYYGNNESAAAPGTHGPGYDQGYDGYNHAQQGYDQGYGGSHHGYDAPYSHDYEYAGSQVGGGYAPSQVGGGYAGSEISGPTVGYAGSNVGGYQPHKGYDEYGRR